MKRVGLVAGLAAFAATAVLAVTRDARTSSGRLGPEDVRRVTMVSSECG